MFLTNSVPLVQFSSHLSFEEIMWPYTNIREKGETTRLNYRLKRYSHSRDSSLVLEPLSKLSISIWRPCLFPLQPSMNKNDRFSWTSCIIFYWCLFPLWKAMYVLFVVLFSSLPHVLNCMQGRDSASHPSVCIIPEGHQASISLHHVWDHFYIVYSHNDSLVHRLQKDAN